MAEVRINVALTHPPARVWPALTEPTLLRAWFMPAELTLEVGGALALEPGPLAGFRGPVTGELIEVAAPHRLVMRWQGEHLYTRVVWELSPTEDGSRLRVVQSGFIGAPAAVRGPLLRNTYHWLFGERLPALLDRLATGAGALEADALHVDGPEASGLDVGGLDVGGLATGGLLDGEPDALPDALPEDAPEGVADGGSDGGSDGAPEGEPPAGPRPVPPHQRRARRNRKTWVWSSGRSLRARAGPTGPTGPTGPGWPSPDPAPAPSAGSSASAPAGSLPEPTGGGGGPALVRVPAPRQPGPSERVGGHARSPGPGRSSRRGTRPAGGRHATGPWPPLSRRSGGLMVGTTVTALLGVTLALVGHLAEGPPGDDHDIDRGVGSGLPRVAQPDPDGVAGMAPPSGSPGRPRASGASQSPGPAAPPVPVPVAVVNSPDRPTSTTDASGGSGGEGRTAPGSGAGDAPQPPAADAPATPTPEPVPELTASMSTAGLPLLGGRWVRVVVTNPGSVTADNWEVVLAVGDQNVINITGADYQRLGSQAVFTPQDASLAGGESQELTFTLQAPLLGLLGARDPSACTIDGRPCD